MKNISIAKIVECIDSWLEPSRFNDYCVNGLQLEGKEEIGHIATAVTASQYAISQAVAQKADLLLVHHGLFWKKDEHCLTGMAYRRCRQLMEHQVGLLAYHLPLDAHRTFGNNAQLAELLGIHIVSDLGFLVPSIGYLGRMDKPISVADFSALLHAKLGQAPQVIQGDHDKPISKVAWCSGAAQDGIERASQLGADAFFSGEISERTYHLAKELGIHYFSAGHHATERYGVQALGKKLADQFGLKHTYIEIDNPV